MTTDDVEGLVVRAEADDTGSDELRAVLVELLERSPGIGTGVALGLLAREPRLKPSRRLLIDPSDAALRRWDRRVTAAAVLLSSSSAGLVRHELDEEFRDSPELAREARVGVTGATGVT